MSCRLFFALLGVTSVISFFSVTVAVAVAVDVVSFGRLSFTVPPELSLFVMASSNKCSNDVT